MSSRALRKAQRELEGKKHVEQLEVANSEDGSKTDAGDTPIAQKSASMFEILASETDITEDINDEEPAAGTSELSDSQATLMEVSHTSRKKKKKKRMRQPYSQSESGLEAKAKSFAKPSEPLDEIDLALRSLSVQESKSRKRRDTEESNLRITEQFEFHSSLAVEIQFLHASNEMKKLFGRAALERDENEGVGPDVGRRRGRLPAGFAGAIPGRNAPRDRNLASLGLRKNIFIQGSEAWPRATTGGLGMEVVEKCADGTVEFRFVHNNVYQGIQEEFQECVVSMDPTRMIQLLQYNPFHISTLLQVSEIAKHERDRATSGELLERALFGFGKAVHSTFSANLSQGKARLDFRRPENREFWLAAWRYISLLGQRATWRTSFEWALLLLSLDPVRDPYCVSLVIDQLALRGRRPQKLIELWSSRILQPKWHKLPNILMSVGLAYAQTDQSHLARPLLKDAIEQHPWVAMRLIQELGLQPVPSSVWGMQPRSNVEHIFTELYVTKAKDIWNTPEHTALLMELASVAQPKPTAESGWVFQELNQLDYTRHIVLTDDQYLIGLLDRNLTAGLTSMSDPLPPQNDLRSYSPSRQRPRDQNEAARPLGTADEMLEELGVLRTFFQTLLPWFPQTGVDSDEIAVAVAPEEVHTTADLERRLQESGIDQQTLLERTQRMQQLQEGIRQLINQSEQEGNIGRHLAPDQHGQEERQFGHEG